VLVPRRVGLNTTGEGGVWLRSLVRRGRHSPIVVPLRGDLYSDSAGGYHAAHAPAGIAP
jgi:hypothetical protein